MKWTPDISADRRRAIERAGRAVVRLQIDPDVIRPARVQNDIVRNPFFSDIEAWDAVGALEAMVRDRGLITAEQRQREHDDWERATTADMHAYRGELFGDDQGADPMMHARDTGAEAGEQCRPSCAALDAG